MALPAQGKLTSLETGDQLGADRTGGADDGNAGKMARHGSLLLVV
jgi:hypothetical protein